MSKVKSGSFRPRLLIALTGAMLLFPPAHDAAAATPSTFKVTKNNKVITCGLINGRYVPGKGLGVKFKATQAQINALKGKTDAKSKAKLQQLKAYQKLGAAVCRRGPPQTPGSPTPTPTPTPTPPPAGPSIANGQAVFNAKCGDCHSASSFKGKTAAQLQNVPGMPSLTAQEADDMAAFVNQ